MDELVRLSAGAPASALLLTAVVVFSALGLFVRPDLALLPRRGKP